MTTNGSMQVIEAELMTAVADANNATTASIDPGTAGANATDAVEHCHQAADHVRSMCNELLAIAQIVKATGDALAADIEARAAQLDRTIRLAREYANETNNTFERERAKLSEMKIPCSGAKPDA